LCERVVSGGLVEDLVQVDDVLEEVLESSLADVLRKLPVEDDFWSTGATLEAELALVVALDYVHDLFVRQVRVGEVSFRLNLEQVEAVEGPEHSHQPHELIPRFFVGLDLEQHEYQVVEHEVFIVDEHHETDEGAATRKF
jgi:hypothetical protein